MLLHSIPAGIGLALAALLCWTAITQLLEDLSAPSRCQTTYIWQSYAQINLSAGVAASYPSYRLIAYTGDSGAPPPGKPVFPVLFVHGHMGSHQQMRSLASETARELRRRAGADPGLAYWLTWQGVDFNEEMSAFSPGLLARQAGFVAACIKQLQATHSKGGSAGGGSGPGSSRGGSASGGAPFRMSLVGYSMGGIVARAALRQLAQEPGFDLASVALLVTLGAPNRHFPSFMPPTALRPLLSPPLPALPGAPPNGEAGRNPAAHQACAAGPAAAPAGGSCRGGAGDVPAPAAAAAAYVPTLAITAGPTDLMVAELFSGAPLLEGAGGAAAAAAAAAAWVQVGMQDVPGVWTTTNHKSIVSCNQLVRNLAPLLADVAQLSLPQQAAPQPGAHQPAAPAAAAAVHAAAGRAGPGPRPAPDVRLQVAELLRRRASTSLPLSLSPQLLKSPASLSAECSSSSSDGGDGSSSGPMPPSGAQAPPAKGDSEGPILAYWQVRPGAAASFHWNASHLLSLDCTGLLLLVNQGKPCRDWSVTAVAAAAPEQGQQQPASGVAGAPEQGGQQQQVEGAAPPLELAAAAQPLPPLVPGVLEQAGGPGRARHWQEIVAGIDWLGNATWLLYVPFAALPAGSLLRLQLAAPRANAASVLAQVLDFHPLDRPSRLPPPGGAPITLPPGSPAVSYFQPPSLPLFPESRSNSSSDSGSWLQQAARVLVGAAAPLRLRVAQGSSCPEAEAGGGPPSKCLLPAVAAVGPEGEQGGAPDVVRAGPHSTSLWRGSAASRSLLVISDPRCCHVIRVEWDVAAWLGVSIRQHAYSLPPLCIALGLAALQRQRQRHSMRGRQHKHGQLGSAAAALLAAAAVAAVAAWGSQRPLLAMEGFGLAPWAKLSAVEALALLALAQGLLNIVRASLGLTLRLSPFSALHKRAWGFQRAARPAGAAALGAWVLAVAGAAAAHPSLALLAGTLRLWLCLAMAARPRSSRPAGGQGSGHRSSGVGGEGANPGASKSQHAQQEPAWPRALRRRPGQPAAAGAALGQQALPGDARPAQLQQQQPRQQQKLGQPLPERVAAGPSNTAGPSADWYSTNWHTGVAWMTFYSLLTLLAAPGLAAWVHSGHSAGLAGRLSLAGAALAAMGLHACWLGGQVGPPGAAGSGGLPPAGGVSGLAALATALAGLWGYPYVAVYACGLVAALSLLEAGWGAAQRRAKVWR